MRSRRISLLALLVPACVAGASGCSRETAAASPSLPATAPLASAAAVPAAPETVAAPPRYPKGRWREAPPERLDRTLLWVSHILIRHVEVQSSEMSFTLTGWESAQPPALRSRAEALALAQRVAQTARAHGNFEELARQYSEDPSTRPRGGSLGGLPAGHLHPWPGVLDALEALKPGEVSDVVETDFGFHVLQRRSPVPEVTASGAHIVIAYSQAPWIALAARAAVPDRSKADALTLAQQIYQQARTHPEAFQELVEQWSEHRDAARGGDFGTWSTREISGYPREIETLARLEVGEVAEPIDTLFGFQVILRTPNQPRERYAMDKIQLRFDAELADDKPGSKAVVFAQAREMAAALQQDPSKFGAFQQQTCCNHVWEVIEGRQLPALEQALARLNPGQIAPQPIEDVAVEYLIPRRLGLDALPTPGPILFELGGSDDGVQPLATGG